MTRAVASDMSARLRVGIVGAGKFGGLHAAKFSALKGVELAAIFDCDQGAARVLADKYGAVLAPSLAALIGCVDGVVITAPASTHGAVALAALSARCHVFVEKPLALTLADADAMISAAQTSGLVLQAGHQERYVAQALGLFDLPEPPTFIECIRAMPATGRGEDVSVIMDLMIHDLDLVAQFCRGDQPVISLADQGDQDRHSAQAQLRFETAGLGASCRVSRRSQSRERSLKLYFGEQYIHLDFLRKQITNTTPHTLATSLDKEGIAGLCGVSDPLAYGAQAFVNAIGSNPVGSGLPFVSGEGARTALCWALQIEQALEQRVGGARTLNPVRQARHYADQSHDYRGASR